MKISARNQLSGTVKLVAVIKSTNVMLAIDD